MESTYERQAAAVCDRARANRRMNEHDMTEAVVLALGVVVEMRDGNTQGHCQRLARHAAATGVRLGLPAGDVRVLHRGGYLHDLGKIAIPDAILLKPGRLTAAERAVMTLHPLVGDAICRQLPLLHHLRPIVRWHHERLDGSGYPDGLKGDRIPLAAQVIGIADVYDALTNARPYKRAQAPAVACEVLMDEVRKGWRRADLVGEFIAAVAAYEIAGRAARAA
jgi:putative two-component system response regulator